MTRSEVLEGKTGALFGQLFPSYGAEDYKHSVDLFARRWRANGLDPAFLAGKTVLDAGCGGRRYSLALAGLGARTVDGIDVSERAIEDATGEVESGRVDERGAMERVIGQAHHRFTATKRT